MKSKIHEGQDVKARYLGKKLICSGCALIFILLLSCKKDFVVANIDDKTITVNGPGDNLQTATNLITFWWDAVDGAEKYNLQVVKPNFNQVAQLVLDTNISKTKFTLSLQPGNYQWRIKAFNAGHSTAYQTFSFRLDTTNNLAQQLVNLLIPANGKTVGTKKVTFTWSAVNSATQYRFQLDGGATKDTTISGTSLIYTLPAASNATTAYTWNVRAINDNSQTQFNPTPSTFTVDLKAPSGPSLAFPVFGSSVKDTTTLMWNRTSPEVAYDSVYVAVDSLFVNSIIQYSAEQAKLQINLLNLQPSTGTTFYWWRVRSFDAVGNRSVYSASLKFKLIP